MKYLFIILVAMFSSPVFSAIAVTSPLLEKIELQNGQVIKKTIKIQNLGRKPVEVKIFLRDRDLSDGSRAHPRSNKKWFKLSQNRLTIGPKETRSINYSIQSPVNTGVGSYWSSIVIAPIVSSSKESSAPRTDGKFDVTIRSYTQYVVTVISNIGEGKASYSFSAPKIENKLGKKTFSVNINNNGNTHGYFIGRLDVFGQNGVKLASLKGGTGTPVSLLPQANKRIGFSLERLKLGKYKALLTAEDLDNGQTFGTDINLTILP